MKKSKALLSLIGIFAAIGWCGSAAATAITRTVLNDGSTVALNNPRMAVGPNGNIHIAAQGENPANPGDATFSEIYYMLVSPSGAVLIDATPISTVDTTLEGRPEIAVLSDNRAVVTWFRSGEALRYALVDPSGDDRDGDAAVPADILDQVETVIGVNTARGHHAIAVDSADIVHVAKGVSSLIYSSFNPATNTVVTAEVTKDASIEERPRVSIALDSADNVHIVYCSNTLGDCPAAYLMLDGTDGATLIAPTQIFDAAAISPKAAHYSVMVDSSDRVLIVYGDKRNTVDANSWCNYCSQGGTTFFTRLNPAADDLSGDAATMATIRVGTETSLGGLWYTQAFLGSDGNVHVVSPQGKTGGNLMHVSVNPSTGAVVQPAAVFDAQIAGRQWSRHYVSGGGGAAVWSEGVFSTPLVNGTLQLVMATVAALNSRSSTVIVEEDDGWLGCTMSTGKAPVDPTLPVLAALAALYLLRRRAAATSV